MKKFAVLLGTVMIALTSVGAARAETAIGVVFGYPGNAGLSLRFDNMPIGAAWSSNFFHGTIDKWLKKTPLDNAQLSWYYGIGADAGIPLDDAEEFFLAARVPIGLQYMFSPKFEGFAEAAPGFQFLDETDFYIAGAAGIRFVLGK